MEWRERVAALEPLGWRGRDAEWVALVCLHSGVFLRGQYLAFIGQDNRTVATRLVKRLEGSAVEELWNGSGLRVCRIRARLLYRALGAENVRHRKQAQRGVLLRRLLSLDYVLEHPGEPWLATEREKVDALLAAGIPEEALPRRVYQGGSRAGRRRYFVHKLPLALGADRARFVFTQGEDAGPSAVRTWGEAHAALFRALTAAGRAVEVVVVGRDPERLTAAGRVVDGWTAAGSDAADRARAELAELRSAVAALDAEVLARYGGLSGAVARIAALEEQSAAAAAASSTAPAIAAGEMWRSVRVPE